GWTPYEPHDYSPTKSIVATSIKKIVLLTSVQESETRTTGQDLANYLTEIENSVEAFFLQADRKVGRDLTIRLELRASEHPQIRIVTEPELPADLAKVLQD